MIGMLTLDFRKKAVFSVFENTKGPPLSFFDTTDDSMREVELEISSEYNVSITVLNNRTIILLIKGLTMVNRIAAPPMTKYLYLDTPLARPEICVEVN